jgi:hypothetical protein
VRTPLRRLPALVATTALLASLAACAPRPTGIAPVTAGDRGARYLARLLQRERRAVMLEGVATIWPRAFAPCDTCPPRRLPALQAGFALAAPDAFRLRVRSAFGTALDLGLSGDSLTAYAPPQRWGVAFDAARDSLGLSHPGSLAARLVSAGWRPPESAWTSGTWSGDLLVLRWSEAADSVAVAVDEAGAPAWARLWRGERSGVLVQYRRWEAVDGVAWPVLLQVQDLAGAFDLTYRLDRAGPAGPLDRSRLAVRIPEGAERLGLDQLRDLLERMESVP